MIDALLPSKKARVALLTEEITWLADTGITTGYSDGTFRPLGTVNRDAMAAFQYRFADEPAFSAPGASPFTHVAMASQCYEAITWLADTGATTGYPDGGFLRCRR